MEKNYFVKEINRKYTKEKVSIEWQTLTFHVIKSVDYIYALRLKGDNSQATFVFTLYYYHIKRAFEIELTRETSNDIKIKSEAANSGQCVYVQVQLSSVCISCTPMRAMQRQRYKSVQITYVLQDMHAYRVYLIHNSLYVCVCECVARICDLIISPVETLKRENLNKSN